MRWPTSPALPKVSVLSGLISVIILYFSAAATAGSLPDPVFADMLARAHSHNDYVQSRPLFDALDQNFYSVEADIWLHHGEIQVSHMGWFFKGSLEDLYLKPLQKLVDLHGSVYGDGRPFYLWVDIKDTHPQLHQELNRILNLYPMLTVFSPNGAHPGAVTVVLTGNDESKRRFVEEFPVRRASRDAGHFSETDPPADLKWSWYAIKWQDWMKDRFSLAQLAAGIHFKGRKLRLWNVPQSEWIWQEALDAQVDQVSVDDLPWMHRFLAAVAGQLPGPGNSQGLDNRLTP